MTNQRRNLLKAVSLAGAGLYAWPLLARAQAFGPVAELADEEFLREKKIGLIGLERLFPLAVQPPLATRDTLDFVLSLPRRLSTTEAEYVIGCVEDALLPLCVDAARRAQARWLWDSQDSGTHSPATWAHLAADEQRLINYLMKSGARDYQKAKRAEWFLLAV